ncbi:hypothetical protein KFU94_48405 [Chloroflexi bacterium TSY]|nr:hypothetical protein [Chloroflexi bacterium TSY]
MKEALAAAVAIQDEERCIRVLRDLIRHVSSEDAQNKALVAVVAIQDEERCIRVLSELIPDLPDTSYCYLLMNISNEWLRGTLIEMILPLLDAKGYQALAEVLPYISDQLNRRIITEMISTEPTDMTIRQQLDSAVAIEDRLQRVRIYPEIIEQLKSPIRRQLLERLKGELDGIEPWTDLEIVQLGFSFCDDQEIRIQLRSRAIEMVGDIADKPTRSAALVRLLQSLKPIEQLPVLAQLMDTVRAIEDVQERATLLIQLDLDIDEAARDELLDIALSSAVAVVNVTDRIELLAALLPQLKENRRPFALGQMLIINDASKFEDVEVVEVHARALTAVLPSVAESQRARVYQRALSASRHIEDPFSRIMMLAQLAAWGDRVRLFGEARDLMKELDDPKKQAEAAAWLLPLGNAFDRAVLLRFGLRAAFRIEDQIERVDVLSQYVPHVKNASPIFREICLVIILHIEQKMWTSKRAALLDYLAGDGMVWLRRLPEEVLVAVGDVVHEVCEEWEWL